MRKFYAVAYNNDYALNYTDEALREWNLATVVYFNSKHDRDEWCEGYHVCMPCSAKCAEYMVYGHIGSVNRGERNEKE